MARTLGVIVAGGRGERLGLGRPKAFAELSGETLLARAECVMRALCDEVVVTAPVDLPLPPHSCARIADVAGAQGPLAGLVAGLTARSFERALALGVDFPRMLSTALASLLERLGAHAAVIPAPGGVPQPLAAAYAARALAGLAASLERGERSVTAAALALDPLVLGDAELARLEGGVGCFFNLNTPADLVEAERRLAAHAERAPGGGGRA